MVRVRQLVTIAALCLPLLAPSAFAQRNLVTNPGFEDGLRGWSFWGGGAPGEIILETEDVHSGTGALRVTNPSGAKVRAYQPPVQLNQREPRPVYLRYWVKRLSDDPDALQCVDLYGRYTDGSAVGLFVNTSVEHVGQWVLMEHTFTPEKPLAHLSVWPLNQDSAADVLFDDIEFRVEPPPRLPTRELLTLQSDGLSLRLVAGSGRVQVRDLVGTDGRRYLAGPPQISSEVNLWSAELVSPTGERVQVLPDETAELLAQVRQTDSGPEATVTWRGVRVAGEPVLDVTARVRLHDGLVRFTADVHLTDRDWGLAELDFPLLAEMTPPDRASGEYLVYPSGIGRILQEPLQNPTGLNLSYPSSAASMQIMAWGDDLGGLYFAAEDGRGHYKWLRMGPETTMGLRYSVGQIPSNTGEPGRDYATPYPVVVGPFTGGWYHAAQIYRTWATEQIWCAAGTLSERDLPAPVRDTAVWMLGMIRRDRSVQTSQPSLTPAELRALPAEQLQAAYLGLSPEENRQQAERFREFFGVPVVWWWTTWMLPAFDVRHGAQVAPKRFEETVCAVTDLGIPVIPYTNIRRFDTGIPEWEQLGMARAAVRGPDGRMVREALKRGETAVMCPACELWQDYFARYALSFVRRGVTGLYLDELGTAAVVPCYAPDHGHPPGGGNHWVQGRREMLRRLRELCLAEQPDFFTGGEEPAEPYIDLNEYQFTYGSRRPDQVPLWQVVYHDYSVCVGRPVGKWYDPASMERHYPEDQRAGDVHTEEFITAMAQGLVWGIQPGWVRPDLPQYAPTVSAWYRTLVHVYDHARPWLLYGRMLPAPRILTELPTVHAQWRYRQPQTVVMPAVLASAWQAPDGDIALVFANVSEDEQALQFAVDATLLEGPRTADRLADDGQWLPAGEVTRGEPAALTLAPRGFAVLRLSTR